MDPVYQTLDELLQSLAQGVHGFVDYARTEDFEIALTNVDEALILTTYWASQRLTDTHKNIVLMHGVRAAFPQLYGVSVVWGVESRAVREKPQPEEEPQPGPQPEPEPEPQPEPEPEPQPDPPPPEP